MNILAQNDQVKQTATSMLDEIGDDQFCALNVQGQINWIKKFSLRRLPQLQPFRWGPCDRKRT
jgi:hypothetical protein